MRNIFYYYLLAISTERHPPPPRPAAAAVQLELPAPLAEPDDQPAGQPGLRRADAVLDQGAHVLGRAGGAPHDAHLPAQLADRADRRRHRRSALAPLDHP